MMTADCRLPSCNEALIQNILVVTMSMVFIAMIIPWFLIALFLLAIGFILISRIFRCALRDLKRLENVSRSPIYSHVTASISGLNTIHAFGKERDFVSKYNHELKSLQKTFWNSILTVLIILQIHGFIRRKLFYFFLVHVQLALARRAARLYSR